MKLKKCQNESCGKKFEPRQIGQRACSTACALLYVHSHPELLERIGKRSAALQRAKARKERRAGLKKLESVTDCLNAAQRAVNRYVVHIRDRDYGCISCGRIDASKYDAGHYRTRKAAAHIRFEMDNIFKQCSRPCNLDLSGNILEMRKGMILRIGLKRVEAIEDDNRIHKWTKEEAREIEQVYKAKLKALA